MPTQLTINFEDIATGKKLPIDKPVRLSAVGAKPTIRVDASSDVVAIEFTLRTKAGQSVPGVPQWTDINPPFRLIAMDRAAAIPPGDYYLTASAVDAKGKATGTYKVQPFTILAETVPPPVVVDQQPTPTPKPDTDGTPPPVVAKPTVVWGLHDAADRPYDAKVIPSWVAGPAIWWTPQRSYARDNNFANAMTYVEAGKLPFWRIGLAPAIAADVLTWLPQWFAKATADMAAAYDGDLYFEVLNEIDQLAYYLGTLDQYVALLKAISEAIDPAIRHRVKLFSAGFSWDISTLEKWAPKFAPYVDGFCFHGYPKKLDTAGMDGITRFGALCIELGKLGVLSEAAPACKDVPDADIPARSAKYVANVKATPGITAAYFFAATPGITPQRPNGYTNGRGAPFDMSWQLTDSGRAIAGAVG